MKKGQYDFGRKAIYMIIAVIVIGILFVFLYSTFSKYHRVDLAETGEIENKLIVQQLVTSCFALESKGKVYPGIIDMQKFSEQRLSCLQYNQKDITVKLNEKQIGKKPAASSEIFERPVLVYDGGKISTGTLEVEIEAI